MKHLIINAKYFLALLVIGLTFSSCEIEVPVACLRPEGAVVTETFDFSEFSRLSVAMDARVKVFEGEQEVTITAAQNVLDRINDDSFTVGDQLNLEIDGCTRGIKNNDIEIVVFMNSIDKLAYLGDGSLETPDILMSTDNIRVSNVGDGDINVKLHDNNSFVDAENIGDGDLIISGGSLSSDISNKGDGDIDAEDLISTNVIVDLLGDGDVRFTAIEDVEIMLAGDGDIRGFGSAIDQNIELLGDGDISNFGLDSENTNISLKGDGDIEVLVQSILNVSILGDGDVCFKGQPKVDFTIIGDGDISDCN